MEIEEYIDNDIGDGVLHDLGSARNGYDTVAYFLAASFVYMMNTTGLV